MTWIVSILVGMQPLPGTVPFFNLVHDHPVTILLAGAVIFAITAAAWILAHQSDAASTQRSSAKATHHDGWFRTLAVRSRLLALTTALSTLTTSTSIAALILVLLHPVWCPTALCPQPPNPHDDHLESGFTAMQSDAYAITGDLARFSLRDLPDSARPNTVAAQRILDSTSGFPPPTSGYRLAFHIHSLERGQGGIIIEQVGVRVLHVSPQQDTVHALHATTGVTYSANPYRVIYEGQVGGVIVPAEYVGQIRFGHVQLAPSETDEVSLQVSSRRMVDLQFRVDFEYRLASERTVRLLELPYMFHAKFADQLHWQLFEFQNEKLVGRQ
ncbi:MAG: hypothetical protein M3072_14355 [Candidatus Dormibacteraeota bacterium]|nr:hypothetical protein [Candidatus Dormibacteraeota bacterium]